MKYDRHLLTHYLFFPDHIAWHVLLTRQESVHN